MDRIKEIDRTGESSDLSSDLWTEKSIFESDLQAIYKAEEWYWQNNREEKSVQSKGILRSLKLGISESGDKFIQEDIEYNSY